MMLIPLVAMIVFGTSNTSAAQNPAAKIEPGYYECQNGNHPTLCPQVVTPTFLHGQLDTLSVVYAGDCDDDGPYSYICEDTGVCDNGGIRFTLKGPTEYLWENGPDGFFCTFKKQ